jgi:7-carboxy-7-deazaguanine synthase (Cx14CxxC type)
MKVNEIFYSIQGEGCNTGRPAIFCRFSGCNLWSGIEKHRKNSICNFCDTDFLDGTNYTEDKLVCKIINVWENQNIISESIPLIVFTGGEPGLQLTESLIKKIQKLNFDIAVETNGTIKLPGYGYYITVSPKLGTTLIQTKGTELKVVWPQQIDLLELQKLDFKYFYLQPMDGVEKSTQIVIDTVLRNPIWRVSLQIHKIIGIK